MALKVTAFSVQFALVLLFQGCHGGAMLDMLDGMQQLMMGSGEYDRAFYDELVACYDQFDPNLMASQDAQWGGMLEYASTGGNPAAEDPWIPCAEDQKWFEHNCTVQQFGSVPIHEPCNYASNMAYYHTAMEICKHPVWALSPEYVQTMFRSFAILGQGSAFFHGSQTHLGGTADVRTNDLFTYIIHQASVQDLEPLDSPIIHELSYTPREKSSMTVTAEILDMFTDLPVNEWADVFDNLDLPTVALGWCGFISTSGVLALDEETFDAIVEWAFENISVLDEELRELCIDNYAAMVRNATSHIILSVEEKHQLRNHAYGTFIKLLYAFVWQEEAIFPGLGDAIFTPETNELGATLLPIVNAFANTLHNYQYYNPNLQDGVNIYPGEEWCNPSIPHAKWHLQTGIALTDAMFLADEVYGIISRFKDQA